MAKRSLLSEQSFSPKSVSTGHNSNVHELETETRNAGIWAT